MGNYNAPVQALESLSNRIGNIGQRRQAHQREMQNLGLSDARLGLERKMREGELGLKKAQFDREQFLNETVTGRQAIMTHPNLSDEQKAEFVDRVSKLPDGETILDALPFTRKQWAAGFRGAIQAAQGRQLQQKMARQRRAPAATDKRTRDQKEFDRFRQENPQYQGNLIDFKRAMKEKDPLSSALTLAQHDPRWEFAEPDERKGIIGEYKDYFNVKDKLDNTRGGKKLTREDAIGYMRRAYKNVGENATPEQIEEAAIKMAQDDGYQVYKDYTK